MPRSSRHTRFCFTTNNPTDEVIAAIYQFLSSDAVKYGVFGEEVAASGTPHLQGFVILKHNVTHAWIRQRLVRSHVEVTRGTSAQARDYCKKDGRFSEFGSFPSDAGRRTDFDRLWEWADEFIASNGRPPTSPEVAREHPSIYLRHSRVVRTLFLRAPTPTIAEGTPRQWQDELEQELDDEASDRSVIFYVDPEGNKGKTWFQQYYLTKYDRAQIIGVGKRDDMAHCVDVSKRVFFFNVPRGSMEHFQYSVLEQLKDRMVFSPKYQSHMKILPHKPHVVVFCNEHPDMEKMSQDRYDIRLEYPE